jgi:hypothetical protein
MELLEAIRTFAESRRTAGDYFSGDGLDTAKGAYCRCDSTSDAFICYAREHDVTEHLSRYDFNVTERIGKDDGTIERDVPSPRNPDPTLYARGSHDTENYYKSGWHAIVETPEFFLDFTAKQYHSTACYPHIINKAVKLGCAIDSELNQIRAAAAAAGGF